MPTLKRKRKSGRWIQKARSSMKKRGTLGSYGHHSAKQMKRDIKGGGKLAKKAQFALNMRKISNRRKKRTGSRRKRTARR